MTERDNDLSSAKFAGAQVGCALGAFLEGETRAVGAKIDCVAYQPAVEVQLGDEFYPLGVPTCFHPDNEILNSRGEALCTIVDDTGEPIKGAQCGIQVKHGSSEADELEERIRQLQQLIDDEEFPL